MTQSRHKAPPMQDWEKPEKDPTGRDAHEEGAKLDFGKPDMSLLLDFGRALEAVATIGSIGARKYTRGGWQTVPDGYIRYTAALGRHLFKEQVEAYDVDLYKLTGNKYHHAWQTAWNALARLELLLRAQEEGEVNEAYSRWYGGEDAEDEAKAVRRTLAVTSS